VLFSTWEEQTDLKEEVAALLEQGFGLTEEQRESSLLLYEKKVLYVLGAKQTFWPDWLE